MLCNRCLYQAVMTTRKALGRQIKTRATRRITQLRSHIKYVISHIVDMVLGVLTGLCFQKQTNAWCKASKRVKAHREINAACQEISAEQCKRKNVWVLTHLFIIPSLTQPTTPSRAQTARCSTTHIASSFSPRPLAPFPPLPHFM